MAADIARRDALDQGRDDSPLVEADDAVVFDTSDRTVDEIVDDLVGSVALMKDDFRYVVRPPTWFDRGFYDVRPRRRLDGEQARCSGSRVSGAEHVPATGPFILAPVHRSNVDTPWVSLVTKRRMRYMGKDSMWKYKLSAWFFTTAGGFPVHRARPTGTRCACAVR